MKKRRLQQLFKFGSIKIWPTTIVLLGFLFIQNIGYSQTALKWSAHLADEYHIATLAIHLDEVNDRLYVGGTVIDPTYASSLGNTYGGNPGTDWGGDAAIACLSPDGTTVHWIAYLGGGDNEYLNAITTNDAGDVFIGGSTRSADFPVNGQIAPYDPTKNTAVGDPDPFVARISADGTTLKYSTIIGEGHGSYSMAVDDDVVYYASTIGSSGTFPVTSGAFQTTHKGSNDVALFSLNTAVGGAAGLLWATYYGGTKDDQIGGIKLAPDGQLVLAGSTTVEGDGTEDFPVTANAIQTPASFNGPSTHSGSSGQFIAKFTTSGALTYSTMFYPLGADDAYTIYGSVGLDIDEDGAIYTIQYLDYYGGDFTLAPTQQYTEISGVPGDSDNGEYNLNIISKLPADLSPQLEYITVLESNWQYATPRIVVDNKKRAHIAIPTFPNQGGFFETNGSLPIGTPTPDATFAYGILSASGETVEYMTTFQYGQEYAEVYGMAMSSDGTVYIPMILQRAFAPATPSYYDFDAGTQKTVFKSTFVNTSQRSNSTIFAFHEPLPNDNIISDFASGNNTFCANSLIYQDPSEGPILGTTPDYQSGDGSSSTHNLPDLFYSGSGTTVAHPTPGSPALKFQWEKSYDGTTWESIAGANLEVLKPESEPAAATVQYRRLAITGSCDTLISNLATATIAGTFNLDINAPTDPVYYCPGTLKDLGITISGASGNISWQWYNGFTPLTMEISPASGTNVAAASFSADIPTTATEGGSYRLVVSDGSACKKEAFVTLTPLTAPASLGDSMSICPGTIPSVTIGPSAENPEFDYSWTGPGGFTSSLIQPTVTVIGTYTLQVKLKSDASFCVGGATSVTINPATAHDDALTAIGDSEFCQSDSLAPIGLAGAPPTNYVYQWAPDINLDDAQAYSPNFDPGSLPFEVTPISEVAYTFTALRLSDGCIFETTTIVSDTARALAQAGIDLPSCGGNTQVFGASETNGNYWEWRTVATTYPGDLAALTAHADFSMDGSTTNLSTDKFLTAGFPSHVSCYTVDYEIIASYVPFPTNCLTRDTVRLFYCPDCTSGDWCSDLTTNISGTDGACSGTTTIISGSSVAGLTYTWTTYSVDGVVQAANTAPQGLFEVNEDGAKGAAFVGAAAHPVAGIADFDDATWGWSGANVVIYRLTANGNFGDGEIDCHKDIQVFSAANATPVIGVLDQSLCAIELPGVRLGSAGKDAPYTISGVDYTQAPNSALDWQWSVVRGTAGSITADDDTPFPTLEPITTTYYQVIAADPVTGCSVTDTLLANVVSVIADAGDNISAVCDGTLVQLGTSEFANHTYSWSPIAGLSSPPITANSMVAEPYLLVGGNATYTVTVTETTSGCQATDAMNVTTTTDAPPAPIAKTFNACPDAVFDIGPDSYSTPYVTYSWTVQSGTADIAWLSATDVLNPEVTLPNSFTGPATFRLTVSQGSCPASFQDYEIIDNTPVPDLGADVTFDCTSSTIQINHGNNSAYEYAWSPTDNLYTNSSGASNRAYDGSYQFFRYFIYAAPTETTTYTFYMRDRATGCEATDDIIVMVPTPYSADAGSTINYCPGSGSVAIDASGTGGSYAWTATGYNSSSNGDPATPTAGEEATMLSYLSSTTGLSINFEQTVVASGKYVYTLTSTNGSCAATDELEVIVPEIGTENLAGISTSICEGESVQLGVSAPIRHFSYTWRAVNPASQSASINDPTSPNPIVNPSISTTYELTYADQITGCSGSENITVSVTPKPSIVDVAMPIQCTPVGSIDLTAQIPSYATYFNQIWYQNSVPGSVVATPTAVNPTLTTNYYVILENEFSCVDTTLVTVNVDNPKAPNIITNVATSCPTTSIDLTDYQGTPSNLAYTLEWHSDNTTNPATLLTNTVVSASGTYYLFETTPNGCSSASDNSVYVAEVCCPTQNCGTVTITINN